MRALTWLGIGAALGAAIRSATYRPHDERTRYQRREPRLPALGGRRTEMVRAGTGWPELDEGAQIKAAVNYINRTYGKEEE